MAHRPEPVVAGEAANAATALWEVTQKLSSMVTGLNTQALFAMDRFNAEQSEA